MKDRICKSTAATPDTECRYVAYNYRKKSVK